MRLLQYIIIFLLSIYLFVYLMCLSDLVTGQLTNCSFLFLPAGLYGCLAVFGLAYCQPVSILGTRSPANIGF